MSVQLAIETLTKTAFAPYGDVLEREGATIRSINEGTTDRFHALTAVEVGDGRAIVSIFAGRRRALPLEIKMLERHPLGSQSFFPLQPFDWLIVVADTVDPPSSLRCFRAKWRARRDLCGGCLAPPASHSASDAGFPRRRS